MNTMYVPEMGAKYGRWEVISLEIKRGCHIGSSEVRAAFWKVRCECGKESWRNAARLISGNTKACKACCRDNDGNNSRISSFCRRFKANAVSRGIDWIDIDASFIEALYEAQGKRCAISNVPISFKDKWKDDKGCTCSIDRIDSEKSYTKDNIHLVHKVVNMMKGTLSMSEFLAWCKIINDAKCG